jgi:hypothetical protein
VLGYIQGKSVKQMTGELDVSPQGLWTRSAPGAAHRLSDGQLERLRQVIGAGSQAAGFTAGVWNVPMVQHWIETNFGVTYHQQHIPRLLHRLPPYSPEFNPTEGVCKTTRKMATHNRFYPTVLERDAALRQTFDQLIQLNPQLCWGGSRSLAVPDAGNFPSPRPCASCFSLPLSRGRGVLG